jgi:hypothetical protein
LEFQADTVEFLTVAVLNLHGLLSEMSLIVHYFIILWEPPTVNQVLANHNPDSYVINLVYFMDNAQKFVAPILLLQDPHTISLIVSDDKCGCFRLIS